MDILKSKTMQQARDFSRCWRVVFIVVLWALGSAAAVDSQSTGDSCSEERSCKLERKAELLLQNDPAGLAKAAFLLTDAMWHKPSVRADQRLRECLELLRPTKMIADLEGSVDAIAVSPDGKWLAAGTDNKALTLFRISSWKRVKTWPVDGQVAALAFSRDSKYLASGTKHYAATYDVATQAELAKVPAKGTVRAVAFSPDSSRVAGGGDDYSVLIFNTLDGKDVVRLPHSGHVTGIQFSPDGARVVTASTDTKIRIFEAPGYGAPRELDAGAPVRLLTMSPDGNWIAAAVDGHKILSWDMRTNLLVQDFIGRAPGSAIAFDPDSRWIAAGMLDGSFRILNQNTRENLFGDRKLDRRMYQILFSPDRRWLAVACEDHTARIYDAATGVESGRISQASEVKSVAFTADSAFLISGSADGILAVSPVVSLTEVFRHRNNDASAVAISPLKGLVAVPTYSHGISLFALAREPKRSILHGADDMVIASFSDSGDLLLSADEHFRASIFDLTPAEDRDKEIPLKRVAHQTLVRATVLSHDALLFAVADDSGGVRVYNAQETGEGEFKPIQYSHPAKALAFSWNNQLLATGNNDGTAHIYQRDPAGPAENWKELPIRPLTSKGEVIAIGFNRVASAIAFGSSMGLVRICKVADGAILIEVNYSERIAALAFTPDGTLLAVALGNGLVHVVRTDTGDEIGMIENHERGIKGISVDDNEKSLWSISMGDSDDLVSRFVAVRKFPLYPHALIRQSCDLLKSFPEEKAWAHLALEEPDHDFCE